MQRNLVFIVIALLCMVGLSMALSFTAGGILFALGCFTAALAIWLLYRGVTALELSADLQAQSLLQRNKPARDYVKGEDHPETTAGRSEAVREEPRPSRPVAAGD